MATNCLVLTDELYNDLIRKTNMKKPRRANNYSLVVDKIPNLLDEFMAKVLPEETLKINKKMVEGNVSMYQSRNKNIIKWLFFQPKMTKWFPESEPENQLDQTIIYRSWRNFE